MDDYLFQTNVDRCKQVEEVTHYLEIFSYSVSGPSTQGLSKLTNACKNPKFNTVEEHPLTPDEFENFLYRKVVESRAGL
jgi:hypothetical protein